MSMAKCQNCKAQDCMPETLQCKARTGEVLHRMLIYWRIALRSAPQNVIIEAHLAKWKPVRRRNKKTPRKSTGKTDVQYDHLVITWAWFVILYLCTNMSSVVHAINQSMSSLLLRFVHAPIKASVFLNSSRVLSQERTMNTIDTKDTIHDNSSMEYVWVSATLLLVCEGVHDELRSMALTYLSKIHITSGKK